MNSTTIMNLQQIAKFINPHDLNNFLNLFIMASSGTTTQTQKKVTDMLKEVESKVQSYIYFLYIFLNPEYEQNVRQITGITMKSTLQRNCKELHFQEAQKNVMKAALLGSADLNTNKLKSIRNILISQLAICFQEVDWELIYYLTKNVPENTDILPLLSTIFEDLKHNRQNYAYFQGAIQTEIIQTLFKNVHQILFSNLSKVNFMESNSYPNEIKILTESFKLIKIITFHLPLKLAEYLQIFVNQIAVNVLKTFSTILQKSQIQAFLTKCNLSLIKTLLVEFFESLNEISETKCQYLLNNKVFLDQFIIYFPINCEQFRKHFNEVCKIWTNIILQLLINDQIEETQQSEQTQINYEKLKMFSYVDIIVSRVILGFRFTKDDEIHIMQEMQLQHNPYTQQEPLKGEGQNESDDQENFQSKQSKAHGSTLRKVSITCIEKLTQQYQQIFWQSNKPLVNEMLKDESDYRIQQSAIVFIAIIAQICPDAIKQDAIPTLQYLLSMPNRLSHEIVLTSTLWAIQKLLPSFIDSNQAKRFIYELIYKVMCNKDEYEVLKQSKTLMVKQAAVSLLDQLLSLQTEVDLQIIQTMLQCLIYALQTFTGRALFNVFKALSSIFEQPQREGVQNLLVGQVVKHLCLKWSVSLQKDSIMCPLIECLSFICESRKKYFIEFATEILQQVYPLFKETERKSLLLRVIDLATSIIMAAKEFPTSEGYQKIKAMVSSEAFLSMMNTLVLAEQRQVRHFGYGLLSDIVKLNAVSNQQAYHFIQTIAQSMDKNNSTSINNALMCITEIIDTHRQVGAKHTKQILQVIVDFILKFPNSKLPKLYLLNFSRMFGRLAIIDLGSARQFCLTQRFMVKLLSEGLRSQQHSELTLSAFRGLILILNSLSSEQLINYMENKQIETFMDSFMAYKQNSGDAENMSGFTVLIKNMKTILQGRNISWGQYLNSTILYPAVIQKLLSLVN